MHSARRALSSIRKNSRIFLPKLGWMRYRNSRQVTGVVKNVTVSQSCGKWYISIQTERGIHSVHPSVSMVGLMLAWLNSPRCPDGTVFEPVNSFQKTRKAGETSAPVKPQGQIQQQLAEAETQNKQLHSRITNIRRDYHKSHNDHQQNHAMIVIEEG